MQRRERVTKTRTETYDEVVEVKCDLCGKKAPSPGSVRYGHSPWVTYVAEEPEVVIAYRKDYVYPEGRFIERTSFDVCSECFDAKVVPWFRSQGAEPTITESDV